MRRTVLLRAVASSAALLLSALALVGAPGLAAAAPVVDAPAPAAPVAIAPQTASGAVAPQTASAAAAPQTASGAAPTTTAGGAEPATAAAVAVPTAGASSATAAPATVYPADAPMPDADAVTAVTAVVRAAVTAAAAAAAVPAGIPASPDLVVDGGSSLGSNTATPALAGTTTLPAGSSLTVMIDSVASEVVVGVDGRWSTAVAAPLADGVHSVRVTGTAGNGASRAAEAQLTVDTVPYVLTLDGGPTTRRPDRSFSVNGTADAPVGTVVAVWIAGSVQQTTMRSDGTWTVPVVATSDGSHAVVAAVSDLAGNVTIARQAVVVDIVPPVLVVDGGPTALAAGATPMVSGTTGEPAGSALTVDTSGSLPAAPNGRSGAPISTDAGSTTVRAPVPDPGPAIAVAAESARVPSDAGQTGDLSPDSTGVGVTAGTDAGSAVLDSADVGSPDGEGSTDASFGVDTSAGDDPEYTEDDGYEYEGPAYGYGDEESWYDGSAGGDVGFDPGTDNGASAAFAADDSSGESTSAGPADGLAYTGVDPAPTLAVAVGLLMAGSGLALGTRRRRPRT